MKTKVKGMIWESMSKSKREKIHTSGTWERAIKVKSSSTFGATEETLEIPMKFSLCRNSLVDKSSSTLGATKEKCNNEIRATCRAFLQ
jgi:hypothetical protein